MGSQIVTTGGGATLDTGRSFWNGASGRWAGEQLARALREGKPMTANALRTADTLTRDEWKFFDEQVQEGAALRLVGVADLIAAGLTNNVPNAMGKTVYEYERVTDMEPATVSLDGVTRSEADRVEYDLAGLPLPLTHKDYFINLRTLTASRTRGESLDTTQARTAGRLVAEQHETMLFRGGKTFGGLPIYGYLTHPSRNELDFGAGGPWGGATGEQIQQDVSRMIQAAQDDRMYGPYWLYVARNINLSLDNDFKTNSDKSTRSRLLEMDGLSVIKGADFVPADNVVLVQATSDVVTWVQGEPLQTVQWDTHGGFMINFKAFAISVPLVRADATGRSGIVHMHELAT